MTGWQGVCVCKEAIWHALLPHPHTRVTIIIIILLIIVLLMSLGAEVLGVVIRDTDLKRAFCSLIDSCARAASSPSNGALPRAAN